MKSSKQDTPTSLYQRLEGKSHNILTPLNWTIGFLESVFTFGLIAASELWVKIFCAFIMTCVLLMWFGVYWYCLLNKSHLLQTEEYRAVMKMLNTMMPESSEGKIDAPNTILPLADRETLKN